MTDELKQWEYDRGYDNGKVDALKEYNGYRQKVIDITTTEDFRKLKRVATVDISENLINELSQDELLKVIIDEISEQMQKGKENESNRKYDYKRIKTIYTKSYYRSK